MVKKSLDAFLASPEAAASSSRKSTCATCTNEPVALLVQRFLDKKAAGLTLVNLGFFQERFLGPVHGYKLSRSSLARHVKKCLLRDVSTGLPYSPDHQPKVMKRIAALREEPTNE